jgi:hypothetical protein
MRNSLGALRENVENFPGSVHHGCMVIPMRIYEISSGYARGPTTLADQTPSLFEHLFCHLLYFAIGVHLHVPTGTRVLGHLAC